MFQMRLIETRGGFMYEHRPDMFPEGYLTERESALWGVYYERKNRESKNG